MAPRRCGRSVLCHAPSHLRSWTATSGLFPTLRRCWISCRAWELPHAGGCDWVVGISLHWIRVLNVGWVVTVPVLLAGFAITPVPESYCCNEILTGWQLSSGLDALILSSFSVVWGFFLCYYPSKRAEETHCCPLGSSSQAPSLLVARELLVCGFLLLPVSHPFGRSQLGVVAQEDGIPCSEPSVTMLLCYLQAQLQHQARHSTIKLSAVPFALLTPLFLSLWHALLKGKCCRAGLSLTSLRCLVQPGKYSSTRSFPLLLA